MLPQLEELLRADRQTGRQTAIKDNLNRLAGMIDWAQRLGFLLSLQFGSTALTFLQEILGIVASDLRTTSADPRIRTRQHRRFSRSSGNKYTGSLE